MDAKEPGHLFLVAKGGEEGYATCTFDDAPFGRKSVFHVVIQYAGIDIWFDPSFPLLLDPSIPAIPSLGRAFIRGRLESGTSLLTSPPAHTGGDV